MKLFMEGRYQTDLSDARQAIYLDGKLIWVQQRPFEYLWNLATHRKYHSGWINPSQPADTASIRSTNICRLRKLGLDIVSGFRKGHGPGSYRLNIEPADIKLMT
jgi:hypothetical protein